MLRLCPDVAAHALISARAKFTTASHSDRSRIFEWAEQSYEDQAAPLQLQNIQKFAAPQRMTLSTDLQIARSLLSPRQARKHARAHRNGRCATSSAYVFVSAVH